VADMGYHMVLCALSFLILAGMTSPLSGQKVSHHGQNVVQWSLLARLIIRV
jgi:hypothetical protein